MGIDAEFRITMPEPSDIELRNLARLIHDRFGSYVNRHFDRDAVLSYGALSLYSPDHWKCESDKKENCSSCKFYRNQECRRRAPKVVVQVYTEDCPEFSGGINSSMQSVWPDVSWDGWCGEYEQKEQEG